MAEDVEVLFAGAEIDSRVGDLAELIAEELPADVTVVVVLKGSFVFAADLVRGLGAAGMRPRIEFLRVSSYGASQAPEQPPEFKGPLPAAEAVAGKTVLVVDDIQDTGRTALAIRELLQNMGAAAVKFCALLDKPSRREAGGEPDYAGFVIPDVFVVGYGIDYDEKYRYLPYIGRVHDAAESDDIWTQHQPPQPGGSGG